MSRTELGVRTIAVRCSYTHRSARTTSPLRTLCATTTRFHHPISHAAALSLLSIACDRIQAAGKRPAAGALFSLMLAHYRSCDGRARCRDAPSELLLMMMMMSASDQKEAAAEAAAQFA
jgi:hypothetical protein